MHADVENLGSAKALHSPPCETAGVDRTKSRNCGHSTAPSKQPRPSVEFYLLRLESTNVSAEEARVRIDPVSLLIFRLETARESCNR